MHKEVHISCIAKRVTENGVNSNIIAKCVKVRDNAITERFCENKSGKAVKKMAENNLGNTQYFRTKPDQELQVKEVLDLVYTAMDEKGYNPVNQIVGYIMSGDPTYITSHKGARSMIMKVERDELVEELLNEYIKNKSWER